MVLKTGEENNDNFSASTEKFKRAKSRPSFGDKEPRHSIVQKMDSTDRRRHQKTKKQTQKRYPQEKKEKHAKNSRKNNPMNPNYHDISRRSNSFCSSSLSNSSADQSIIDSQKRKIYELECKIKDMKRTKQKQQVMKDMEISPQFEWNIKLIVKDFIFPKLKFITSSKTLQQDIRKKSSVGYAFLKHYKAMYVQTNHVLEEDLTDEELWNNAKNIVYKTIKQKRGTVQSELKKAWKGKQNESMNSYSIKLLTSIYIPLIHRSICQKQKGRKN